jgi:uncharacterized protein DUF6010
VRTLSELAVGFVLGALLVLSARRGGPARETPVFALGLIVAALIYIGFALANGAPVRSLLLESLGVIPFGLLAWLGSRRSQLWLALGWAAHTAWDLGFHLGASAPAFVPSWYPVVCTSFDLLVAGYIVARVRSTSA